MGETSAREPFVLGLDIGARSIGWAVLGASNHCEPNRIIGVGVRCFEAGVDGNIEQGRDSSRAANRRQKRQTRRMLRRRARRMAKLFRLLQCHGLLPAGPARTPQERHDLLAALDRTLRDRYLTDADRVAHQVLPYRLRAMALDGRLDDHELGRALYHLAQRRGFLSNRRADRKDKDDETVGKVKEGINRTYDLIRSTGSRTLGEALSRLDPEQVRIRQRWTARGMYLEEFKKIWDAQAAFAPDRLTEAARRDLHAVIFHQRPLKPNAHLIGRCELEPAPRDGLRPPRRAPIALPVAQRFRLLQKVNDLQITEPTGELRGLSPAERKALIDVLSTRGDMTFSQIRAVLGLKKDRKRKDPATGQSTVQAGHGFNLEAGGEDRIPGDRTAAKLVPILSERWGAMSPQQQEGLVRDLLDFQHPKALAEHLQRVHGVDEPTAKALSEVALEDDYAPFSRKALGKLAESMEGGVPFMTARQALYPQSFEVREAVDRLPPVNEALPDLRNPAVTRALTEVRKVVSAIMRRYGRPELIRVELARDLKQPRKAREQVWRRNRDRQNEREAAKARILSEAGIQRPSRDDVEKVLLADECGWKCPYTGRSITMSTLLGRQPQFDIEHIIPRHVSLDDSFANKTLCYHEENRHAKQGRTPFEAYAANAQKYHEILVAVHSFSGPAADEKLRRFQMTPEDVMEFYGADFTARHLADTRYASRLAAKYLGLLYGGVVDGEGKRRVQASSGSVTAYLRDEWELNGILPSLPDSPCRSVPREAGRQEKERSDHRHHAIDAVVIAHSSAAVVKMLCQAAADAPAQGRRRFALIRPPWAGFQEDVRDAVARITVSHRVDRRLAGPLHAETYYSRAIGQSERATGGSGFRHKRVPLINLTRASIKQIVDERVRELVEGRLGDADPRKFFTDPANLPSLPSRSGSPVPIRSVRVRERVTVQRIGNGARERHVASGTDTLHHTVILRCQTPRGEVWKDEPADRLEVYRRLRDGRPIVRHDWGVGAQVIFSLCKGDCIEMEDDAGARRVYVVRSVSRGDMTLRLHNDGRTNEDIDKAKERAKFRIRSADELRKRNARKVTVLPLGEVCPCCEGPYC